MGDLKPFFCFFGGKFRAAKKYPRPKYGRIVEPFAGGAGYATRHHQLDVILCDVDPILYGVWHYLTRVSRAEVLALPLLIAGEDVQTLTHIPQEARWLIGFWLNKGMTAPCRTLSAAAAGMVESGRSAVYWGAPVRERIASQVEYIRHWKVVNDSYAEASNFPATWFVDPPYQKRGVRYRFGSKGIDYTALGAWCRARQGQVIVCEQHGADWLPFEDFGACKSMSGALRDGSSHEVVYVQ
jgi:hypothetical protein